MSKVSAHQPGQQRGVAVGGRWARRCAARSRRAAKPTGALRNCSQAAQVAASVGVAGHAGHQPAVLEQEDAGALDLAELGELAAGVGRAGAPSTAALAADSMSPSSTSACAVRRCSERRVQAAARATASRGRGLAEQAAGRRRRRVDGEDADDLAVDAAAARRAPSGCRACASSAPSGPASVVAGEDGAAAVRMTVRQEGGAGQGQRAAGAAASSTASAVGRGRRGRKGTTVRVVASCTHTADAGGAGRRRAAGRAARSRPRSAS